MLDTKSTPGFETSMTKADPKRMTPAQRFRGDDNLPFLLFSVNFDTEDDSRIFLHQ